MSLKPVTKEEALKYLDNLEKDFDMLLSGDWVPDRHSCEASQEIVDRIRRYITEKDAPHNAEAAT